MDGPPYGDRYLGFVTKTCEETRKNIKSDFSHIGYTPFYTEGCGANDNCSCLSVPKINDYGTCAFPTESHVWYIRDWDSMSGDNIMSCCVTPPGDPNAGDICIDKDGNKVDCDSDKFDHVKSSSRRSVNCPPTLWAGSPLCLGPMLNYCKADNWEENGVCDKYVDDFSGSPVAAKEQVITSALDDWVTNDLNGGQTEPSENDPFVQKIGGYCAKYPGLCDIYLSKACSQVTKDDLLNNPNLSKLCGCFMQDNQYMLPGIIPVECNGICGVNSHPDINGVLRGQLNQESGLREKKFCEQTTCVMDDITIALINSEVDGPINFSQICGNCPGGGCTCVFDNITLVGVNSQIGNGLNLEQNCSSCSQSTEGTNATPVSCGEQQPVSPPSSGGEQPQDLEEYIEEEWAKNKPFWIAGIALLVVLIIGLFCFFYLQVRKQE
jgi:hypothetical protein